MRLYGRSTLEPITNSLCYVIYKTLPNNTDFTIFKAASYQGFNLAFIGDVAYYHTPLDSFENASPATMQHQGANALSGLLALANATDVSPPAADSLFFDVLARSVIVWPIGFVLPASLAALALLAAATVSVDSSGTPQRTPGRVWFPRRARQCSAGRRAGSRCARAIAFLGEAAAHPRAFLDRLSPGDARWILGVDCC